jgi:hypothetical protein
MLLAQDSDLRNRIDPTFQHFPKLAKYFPTPQQRRQRAMAALHCMGESAVPFLIQVFQNERTPADVRTFEAYTFLGFPKRSAGAVPALKRARDTADPLLAYIAGEALKSVETGATDSERLEDQRD